MFLVDFNGGYITTTNCQLFGPVLYSCLPQDGILIDKWAIN
jgi:hypothetical protein